jgi:hypothetical protein
MDEHAHLPTDLDGYGDERPRQLRGRDVIGRDAAPVKAFEGPQRRRRQAARVAEDLDATP